MGQEPFVTHAGYVGSFSRRLAFIPIIHDRG
jgi:hypothetical protein